MTDPIVTRGAATPVDERSAPLDERSAPVDGRPSAFRIWLLAIRPATLPAAVSGIVVGLGAALAVRTPFRVDAALGCMAVALLLQIAANLANDLSDFRSGADTPDRTGPTRVAAAGLVTERQLEVAIAIVVGLAGLVGLALVTIGGPVLLVVGALAIVAAVAYTGGPWPYGYHGLGEVFVFVFFGLIAVVGTAYLQAGAVDPLFVAAAIPVGCLTTAILVVNNLRDIPTDRVAGKRTLAVIVGRGATVLEYVLLLTVAFVTPPLLAASGLGWPLLLPLLATPLAWPLVARARSFTEPGQLNPVLKGTARVTLVHALLFAAGLTLAGATA